MSIFFQFIGILSLFINISTFCYAEQTIGIYTYGKHFKSDWDPDIVSTGIYGSEEAIIYLSKELANLGYKVLIFASPKDDSPYTSEESNPRYIHHMFHLMYTCDIAISWRFPVFQQVLKTRAKKVYFWPHDTSHSLICKENVEAYDNVLWLSKWQRNQWVAVSPGFEKFTDIFGNGINPEDFKPVEERENPYACIYGSSYDRGLEFLLSIWPDIKKEFPRATLDIYYGYTESTLINNKELRNKVESLADLDVREHGIVGHEELNRAYSSASFWTYPCTSMETFCISGLRAQLCGAIPVIIDGSALTETVRHGYMCSTQEEYLETLRKAMREVDNITLEERKNMGDFILKEYTWKRIAELWHHEFQGIKSPR